jgi:non-specific serine/threonine protein kinase/serine/threonine-protein kinase
VKPERWRKVREILEEAIPIPSAERQVYLDQALSNDAELRLEVESLLRSHEKASGVFLNTPAVDWASSVSGSDGGFDRVGRRIGVYQIVGEIGRGGMGEVYRALRADGQYEKEVAIKLVRVGLDTSALLARFRRERQILANLDHPNIARLLDGGTTEDGIPYLVMELVAGLPIDAYCEEKSLDVTGRLRIFLQVCTALQFAHQRLVIHRDIKPSNILVTEDGTPKLLDFGIAKIAGASGEAEETALRPMTLEYSSPEQIRGESLNTATDVYSLGVVLYRLLTGRSPYTVSGDTPHDLSRAIAEDEPKRPSAVVAAPDTQSSDYTQLSRIEKRDVPRVSANRFRRRLLGDLDNIVLNSLRKEPQRRYASVEQFADDIRRHLAGVPVTASKDSWSYRAGKFVRRNRAGVTAAALVVMTLFAGLIVTLREARIAAQNERRAQQHFNDVRQLADSLMFEVHDSIQDLPGATPARQLIVQRSLEYLNRLASESGGETSLQRELANAYERIGLVQGDPDASNLGDISGARDSFRKALNIREQLANLKAKENFADLVALAASDRELCRINARYLGSIGTALDYCSKAVTISERQIKMEPDNRAALTELAKDYEATGRAYGENSTAGNAGDSYKALENHRKALALVEDLTKKYAADSDLRSWQGSLSILTADDLFETGHVRQAVPLYQQAARTFESISQQNSSLTYLNFLPLAYQRMGDMLLVDGRFEESLPYYRQQLETATKLVVADPKSLSFRGDLVAARATYGHALWRAGHVEEGLASLRRGLEEITAGRQMDSRTRGLETTIRLWVAGGMEKGGDPEGALHEYQMTLATYSDICRSDPKDVEDCIMLAGVLDRVGRIHLRQNKFDEALAEYQRALEIIEPLSTGDEPNLEALYTMVNVDYGLGEVNRVRAGRARVPRQRGQNWIQARNWYEKSHAAYLRIPSWQPITPNELESRSLNTIEARLSLFQHAPARISASNTAR